MQALRAELSRRCHLKTGTDPVPGLNIPSPAEIAKLAWPPSPEKIVQLGETLRAVYEQIETARLHPPVPVVQDVYDQPPESRVMWQKCDDGVTLMVPPGGIGIFFLLGCGLCAFAALPTMACLISGVRTPDGSYGPLWMTLAFWAIALAVFLPAFHHARARVVLAVVGDDLEMLETSPIHSRRRSWNRTELANIVPGDNGWVSGGGEDDSNMTPVAQLHIVPKVEKKVGLLTGRDFREIAWMATVLRQALRLPDSVTDLRAGAG
jgi:hypothetical protein